MTARKKNYPRMAKRYAAGVVSGAIPACEWVKKACRRQLADLERKGFEYRFDEKKASRICRFIEMLPRENQ
jgi:phage terminase large subunit-like protein